MNYLEQKIEEIKMDRRAMQDEIAKLRAKLQEADYVLMLLAHTSKPDGAGRQLQRRRPSQGVPRSRVGSVRDRHWKPEHVIAGRTLKDWEPIVREHAVDGIVTTTELSMLVESSTQGARSTQTRIILEAFVALGVLEDRGRRTTRKGKRREYALRDHSQNAAAADRVEPVVVSLPPGDKQLEKAEDDDDDGGKEAA